MNLRPLLTPTALIALAAPASVATAAPFDPSGIVPDAAARRTAQWALVGASLAQNTPATGNLALSPASLTDALQALWWGTRGTTAEELGGLFGLSADSPIPPGPATVGTASASALFVSPAAALRPEYLALLASRGAGSARQQDWSDVEAGREAVNAWVAEATNGKIETLFEEGSITQDVAFVLANAVTFEGEWATGFDPDATISGDFIRMDGTTVPAAFLRATRDARLAKIANDGPFLLELPFAGDAARLVAILPAQAGEEALQAVEADLAEKGAGWIAKLAAQEVEITLPKFTVAAAFDPEKSLHALGVSSIFDPGTADLSGISEARDLHLDALRHSAVVTVHEAGAEAAAATGASVAVKSLGPVPTPFRADRPFVFLLLSADDQILFAGRVADPAP